MQSAYNINGLVFWSEREIRLRNQFAEHFAFTLNKILVDTNKAWSMIQIEAPILTPKHLLSKSYADNDIWCQDEELALRPETTPGSYTYATALIESHSSIRLPFCVWQVGKSFRREQNNVLRNVRLKEFYQQEFQCFYAADTKNDYHSVVLASVAKMIKEMIGKETRIVKSDRLPNYSEITMDIECCIGDRWMELCSISRRTDFETKAKFTVKKKNETVEKGVKVLEIAIGLDRCVYSFEN